MGQKTGLGWGKGHQRDHLMPLFTGMTERQHGIFAATPECDDARHGFDSNGERGDMLPSWRALGKAAAAGNRRGREKEGEKNRPP
ncbi:hypothetical protein D3C80_1525310 [compost metagenome]